MLFSFVISLVAACIVTQIAVFSTTIYLHRTATHRALVLHPGARLGVQLALWFTTGHRRRREWVAVHRKHHAFTDRGRGSAQPAPRGILDRAARQRVLLHAGDQDDRRRRALRPGHRRGLVGSTGLRSRRGRRDRRNRLPVRGARPRLGTACGRHSRRLYVFVLSSSINGLCHHVGYKNFDNTATNIRLLALLTGGEGLHNNHHGYPRSPKFSLPLRASSIPRGRSSGCSRARPRQAYKTINEVTA